MPTDLATVTPDSFAPFIGQAFTAGADGADVSLTLKYVKVVEASEVRDIRVVIDGVEIAPRQAFALTFKGPPAPELAQGTFALEHPEFADLAVFLTPIRREEDGVLYESIFN